MTVLSKNAKIIFISGYFSVISGVISEMVDSRRRRLVRKYPAYTLIDSLTIPDIIFSENAGLPIDRNLLASSLGTTVNSSSFTTKLASSEEYGLTKGRYKDNEISITELGISCVAYQNEQEKQDALRIASLTPDIFEKLNALLAGKELPEEKYFASLLIRTYKIHPEQTRELIYIYKSNIELVGVESAEVSIPINKISTKEEQNTNPEPDQGFLYSISPKDPQKNLSMLIMSSESMEKDSRELNKILTSIGLQTNLFIYKKERSKEIFNLNDTKGPFVISTVLEGTGNRNDNFLLGLAQGLSGNKIIPIVEHVDYNEEIKKYTDADSVISINDDLSSVAIKLLEALNKYNLSNIQLIIK